jgi:hypothetical protein
MNRNLLVALAAIAVIAGVAWYFVRDPARREALHSREIATRVLAEYLSAKFPGRRVLVASNPFTQTGAPSEIVKTEQAGIAGLREGFDKKNTLTVAFPELKPEARTNPRSVFIDGQTTTPLSFLVAENAFDKLAREHPASDLIVSLIGLPAALDKVQCWRNPGPPQFALLLPDLRMIGDSAAVKAAMQSGKLVAFVLAKPGVEPSNSATDKTEAEFQKQFLLVTMENIDRMVQQYPMLFKAD